jgi:hypothetical protein
MVAHANFEFYHHTCAIRRQGSLKEEAFHEKDVCLRAIRKCGHTGSGLLRRRARAIREICIHYLNPLRDSFEDVL